MKKHHVKFYVVAGVALILVSCQKLILPQLPDADTVLDQPIATLTPTQLSYHNDGDIAFGRIFAEIDGLGPIFVANSCESCHNGDGKGHPATQLTRFGKMENGVFDPMLSQGGPQLQTLSIPNYIGEVLPAGVTGVTRFIAPAVSGLGYIEAIADADILAWADAADANGDGISGVPQYVSAPDYFVPQDWHIPSNDKYIGRFGRKASAINLLQQTVEAYRNDMGVTSDFNMNELYNVQVGLQTGDNTPDPEVSASDVHSVVFYLQTLKVPPRRGENNADVIAGELIFKQIGCDKCHRPSFVTQKNAIAALSEKTVYPYSDFLLHDMGSELDDRYTEGTATTAEWRTTPLWGLGLSDGSQGNKAYYLHDGRAKNLTEAILLHGGEGNDSREKFKALSTSQVNQLFQFLSSL